MKEYNYCEVSKKRDIMRQIPGEVKGSTGYVVVNSDHVHIDRMALWKFRKEIRPMLEFAEKTYIHHGEMPNWINQSPFPISSLTEKEQVHLMVAFNSMSFSYWGDPYWQVTHKGTTYERGSWSLLASLFRAREEEIDILNPSVQAEITESQLEHILRGNRKIPLLEERAKVLRQIGLVVSNNYDNDFRNMMSGNDAEELILQLVEQAPLFEDTAMYKGRKISFYKRAQALVQSVHSLSLHRHLSRAYRITALADYILPRVLRDKGILVYSKQLAHTIDSKIEIPAKSNYEVEIRANTIHAVNQLAEDPKSLNLEPTLTETQAVNDYLWLTEEEKKPFYCTLFGKKRSTYHHRTRTTAY